MQIKNNCNVCNEPAHLATWFGGKGNPAVYLCQSHNSSWMKESKKTLTDWWLDRHGLSTNTGEHTCRRDLSYPRYDVPLERLTLAFAIFLTKTFKQTQIDMREVKA